MSASVVRSARAAGTTATTSVGTITAPNAGSTLLIQVAVPTANAPLTAFTDNLGNSYTQDHLQTTLNGNFSFYYYRISNIANAPTSLSATGTTGSFSAVFSVIEVTGLDNTSPKVSVINTTQLSGGVSQTTHTASYTTTNTNDFVMLGVNNGNLRNLSSVTTENMVVVADGGTSQIHLAYYADAGAAGAKSSTLTFSGPCGAWILGVVYKAAKPAVTSVSDETGTEGTTITHTVTLASATTATTGYSGVLTGVTASTTTDLTSTLLTATYSNGVTFSAGNFSVPSSVSSWTIALDTTQDGLDEVDETYTLNVDGTVGTGTITDDDALPSISITPSITVDGGDSVVLTCTLGAVSGRVTQARLVLADGTKVGGVDYTNVITDGMFTTVSGSGTVTISAGVLSIPAGVVSFTITMPTTA